MMQLCILQLHALKCMACCGFSPHGPNDEQVADACKLFPSRRFTWYPNLGHRFAANVICKGSAREMSLQRCTSAGGVLLLCTVFCYQGGVAASGCSANTAPRVAVSAWSRCGCARRVAARYGAAWSSAPASESPHKADCLQLVYKHQQLYRRHRQSSCAIGCWRPAPCLSTSRHRQPLQGEAGPGRVPGDITFPGHAGCCV